MQVKRKANMMTDHVLKSTDGFSFGGVLKTGKTAAAAAVAHAQFSLLGEGQQAAAM